MRVEVIAGMILMDFQPRFDANRREGSQDLLGLKIIGQQTT
jgi:hypothetical protein